MPGLIGAGSARVMLAQAEAALDITSNDVIVIVVALVVAMLLVRTLTGAIRAVLRANAHSRARGRRRAWRIRSTRLFGESTELAELRRRQRIDATASALGRIASAAVLMVALVIILERLEVDPVVALSGAGFLGVAIAIGGQNSVNDFVTGLHILFEDRFGEGDRLELSVHDRVIEVEVAHLGAFATRLDGPQASYHIANREMTQIVNLSQRGVHEALLLELPDDESLHVASLERSLGASLSRTVGFDPSVDGLVVDSVTRDGDLLEVEIRTARRLTAEQLEQLSEPLAHPG